MSGLASAAAVFAAVAAHLFVFAMFLPRCRREQPHRRCACDACFGTLCTYFFWEFTIWVLAGRKVGELVEGRGSRPSRKQARRHNAEMHEARHQRELAAVRRAEAEDLLERERLLHDEV